MGLYEGGGGGGAYTWSNTSVEEKIGLSAGGLYTGAVISGEIRYNMWIINEHLPRQEHNSGRNWSVKSCANGDPSVFFQSLFASSQCSLKRSINGREKNYVLCELHTDTFH